MGPGVTNINIAMTDEVNGPDSLMRLKNRRRAVLIVTRITTIILKGYPDEG